MKSLIWCALIAAGAAYGAEPTVGWCTVKCNGQDCSITCPPEPAPPHAEHIGPPAYGAEPPKDWQGWTLQPDGCNYCSATECTAMSCLPISERRSAGPPPMSTHAVCGGSVSGEWETWEPRSNGECSKDDAPSEHKWHVLVQTYGGTVSLIKDLTKHEADFISKRLLHEPATPKEEKAERERLERCAKEEAKGSRTQNGVTFGSFSCAGGTFSIGPGYIISAEVFQ